MPEPPKSYRIKAAGLIVFQNMADAAGQQIFKCFVIMPFSDTEHDHDGQKVRIVADEWTHIFTHWIKKAVESFAPYKFQCVRSPAQPGNFIKGIVRDLSDSDIVIADLTGSKANVYYELGIRHGLETGTIMITQDLSAVPTDLRGYYTFEYRYTGEYHQYDQRFADFERQLHEKMAYIFDNLSPSDNPVSDFLGHSNEYLRQTFEQERNDLVFLAELFRDTVNHHQRFCESLVHLADKGELPDDSVMLISDPFPFDLLLMRLINTRWRVMPMQTLQTLNEVFQDIRHLFLAVHQGWEILRINPTSEMNTHFFDMVRAAAGTRGEEQRKILDDAIEAAKSMDYSVTFTPKAEVLKGKHPGAKTSSV